MQRYEVEAIFEQEKENFLRDYRSSKEPFAIILGGQPACGKSTLIKAAQKDNHNLDFLIVNGDLYRQFHPEHNRLFNNTGNYSAETQIFSNVFTEKLIEEAIRRRCNIIVEGTMRNPDVPLKTARMFRDAGFRVEAYVIAAPGEFTRLGLYNRYQEEVLFKGNGRLADIESHNKAVDGLLDSVGKSHQTDPQCLTHIAPL